VTRSVKKRYDNEDERQLLPEDSPLLVTEEAVVKAAARHTNKQPSVARGGRNEITLDNQTTVKLNDLSYDSGSVLHDLDNSPEHTDNGKLLDYSKKNPLGEAFDEFIFNYDK